MNLTDIIVVAVIAAILFFSIRSLVRANKNGCSDCGGNCSGSKGSCSAAKKMLADADAALAHAGSHGTSCCKQR